MKRILVDQDGVIANYEAGFAFWFEGIFPGYKSIPLERRKGFYVEDQYGELYPELKNEIEKIPTRNGFYASLPIIRGAKEGLNRLLEIADVRICTAPKIDNSYCASEKTEWIRRNFGEEWVKRIIITRDKTLIRGDFLIDDKPDIEGLEIPTWEQIFYDQPYNRDIKKKRIVWGDFERTLIPWILD